MRTVMKTSRATAAHEAWLQRLVVLIVVGLCVLPHATLASEGCQRLCRATGLAGVIGNCACGLSLFSAKKRSSLPSRMSDPFIWQNGNLDRDVLSNYRAPPPDMVPDERRTTSNGARPPLFSYLRRK